MIAVFTNSNCGLLLGIIFHTWGRGSDTRDAITRLKSHSQALWLNGSFFNPIFLQYTDDVLKYDITTRTTIPRGWSPNEILLKINMDLSIGRTNCASSAEYLVPKEICRKISLPYIP
ncbi:hypothetical protein AHF37_06625 [Paragonimus kellicotti]|nr:hypothetical protein AHF37_06625 [Paragonimus kellicotti]